MGAEGKYDLRLAPSYDPDAAQPATTPKSFKKTSVLTSRKSSSTPSLPEATESGRSKASVASTEQATSVDNLTASSAAAVADSVLSLASTEALGVFERVRAESTGAQSTDDDESASSAVATLVGALSLMDPGTAAALAAAGDEGASDSHKNAKNTMLASAVDSSPSTANETSNPPVTINVAAPGTAEAAAAAVRAALEGIVVDDQLMADVTEEMLEINAFDLLRSLERQANRLQAEADQVLADASVAVTLSADSTEDDRSADGSPPQPASKSGAPVRQSGSMSVSVPNLTSTSEPERESDAESTPPAFLESFANVARRYNFSLLVFFP